MKSSRCCVPFRARNSLIKYLLMTKIAILLLFAFSTQSFAKSYGQKNINLRLENVELKKAFKVIESKCFFHLGSQEGIVPKAEGVSIGVQNASLEDVLGILLARTSLRYRQLSDNLVVITPDRLNGPPSSAAAQPVSGKVVNARSEPLTGVTVQEKGTNNGTATGDDGSFSLPVTNPNALLVFSYIGYQSQEVPVSGRTQWTITMVAENTNLNEVVVIGYQTVRRKDLTGATGVVNMTEANKITTGSVGEAIQGLVPGVTVRNSGAPGSNATVEIRGVGSFTNSSPLYVIDGMLADANTTVNPDDVASIQILKDASTTHIYTSRARNEILIITTKKGKDGPAKFSLSAKYGIHQIPKK